MTTHDTHRMAPGATLPAAAAMLAQCRSFVEGLGADVYAEPCAAMFGASIGQHVRHSLDHFAAALDAFEGGVIEYDRRERDTDVEKSPEVAVGTIDVLASLIHAIDGRQADRLVTVRVMLSDDGAETDLTSTFARELAFASHHAVHHHAMIASIAGHLGLSVPEGFGKAPSTLAHERAAGA